jgi:hypothetical protein
VMRRAISGWRRPEPILCRNSLTPDQKADSLSLIFPLRFCPPAAASGEMHGNCKNARARRCALIGRMAMLGTAPIGSLAGTSTTDTYGRHDGQVHWCIVHVHWKRSWYLLAGGWEYVSTVSHPQPVLVSLCEIRRYQLFV